MQQPTVDVAAKPYWLSKTLAVNALAVVILVVGIVLDAADVLALPPTAMAWGTVLLAVANALLRFATSQPIAASSGVAVAVPAPEPGS